MESDLIVGANGASAIGTIVDRTTRIVTLVRVESKKAVEVVGAFIAQMKLLPALLLKTLTHDNGKEMSLHKELSSALDIEMFFADPHTPWQRGSNENMNGLLREFFPKGIDLSVFSQAELNKVAFMLNNRPREMHNFLSPQEVLDRMLQGFTYAEALAMPIYAK
jgi:IS30 family transposase